MESSSSPPSATSSPRRDGPLDCDLVRSYKLYMELSLPTHPDRRDAHEGIDKKKFPKGLMPESLQPVVEVDAGAKPKPSGQESDDDLLTEIKGTK